MTVEELYKFCKKNGWEKFIVVVNHEADFWGAEWSDIGVDIERQEVEIVV